MRKSLPRPRAVVVCARAAIVALCAAGASTTALLAGCSGLKPYPNTAQTNLQIRTRTESGSPFGSVRAAVHIHRVDARCQLEYQGTVDLDQANLAVGIPTDRPSYLVFTFASSSFLGGSRSTISQETLLKPRAGYRYDAEVSYRNDLYNVVLRERAAPAGHARDIPLVGLNACAASEGVRPRS